MQGREASLLPPLTAERRAAGSGVHLVHGVELDGASCKQRLSHKAGHRGKGKQRHKGSGQAAPEPCDLRLALVTRANCEVKARIAPILRTLRLLTRSLLHRFEHTRSS